MHADSMGLLEGEVIVTADALSFEGKAVREGGGGEARSSPTKQQSGVMLTLVIVPFGRIECRSRGADGIAE